MNPNADIFIPRVEIQCQISMPSNTPISSPNVHDLSTPLFSVPFVSVENDHTLDHQSISFCSSPNVMYLGDEICLTPLHGNPSTPNVSSLSGGLLNLSANPRKTGKSIVLNPKARPFIPNNDEIISDKESPSTTLQNLRLKNVDKIIIGHININSVRNKIHMLADIIRGRVDIMLISETKLDNTFPKAQFFLQGYSEPVRLDRTANGGGLLLYLRDDIPVKQLPVIAGNIECVISEVTISKKKWLLLGTYNPSKSMISKHLSTLETSLCHYLSQTIMSLFWVISTVK